MPCHTEYVNNMISDYEQSEYALRLMVYDIL